MKADLLLGQLNKVKRTGNGTWIACCPAHDDRTPSMTIRELEDGRILLHCFGGCEVQQILGNLGLTFDALFPEKLPQDRVRGLSRPFPATDILAAVADDAMLVAVTVANLGRCEVTPEQYVEMFSATGRILEARRIALGR